MMMKIERSTFSRRMSTFSLITMLLFSILGLDVVAFTTMPQHHVKFKGRPGRKILMTPNAEEDAARKELPSPIISGDETIEEESVTRSLSRRRLLQQSLFATSLLFPFSNPLTAEASSDDKPSTSTASTNSNISVYQIIPDDSAALSPSIKPINPSNFDAILSFQERNNSEISNLNENPVQNEEVKTQTGGVVWFGEHHNSKADHDLQTQFIQSVYNQQLASNGKTNHNMSIGLEQVQIQFQQYLDDFVSGRITEKEMLEGVQWQTRWQWDYANYRPIFELARKYSIPLIALNVNSEDLAVIEESGIRALSRSQLKTYISDPSGFGTFLQSSAYKAYNSYLIQPSYSLHQEMGILKTTVTGKVLENDIPFANFFSGHIMWDESMAWNAYKWTRDNPGGIMIGLIGAGHVKFEKGVVGRYKRLVEHGVRMAKKEQASLNDQVLTENASSRRSDNETFLASTAICPPEHRECLSVLLNPTLVDSKPSGSIVDYTSAASSINNSPDRMTLQLSYLKDGFVPNEEMANSASETGGVLPLADYIVMGM